MVRSESKISPRSVVSHNRLSVCCVTWPKRQSDDFALAFEYYPRRVNNAASSWILGNPAVFHIL